jgi:glycosyltransferase involved in cell wall biosynthesis
MKAKHLLPKLLYAVDPPLSVTGGVSVLVQVLIKYFSKHYQIYLLSTDSPDWLASQEIGSHLSGHVEWKPGKGPPRLEYLKYASHVAEKISQLGIQLVHFHAGCFNFGNRTVGFSLSRQLRKRGVPSVWTTHGFSLLKGYCGPNQSALVKMLLFSSAWLGKFNQLQHTECEILVSQFDLQMMRRVWFPLRSKCIQMYHSKLDVTDADGGKQTKTILSVGYISFNKRQELLAQAFLEIAANYPDWELHFLGHNGGDGCQELIERLIETSPAGNRIHFLGSHNDVGPYLQACGIYVTASDFEGLPLAPQEAMHYGCPVIASDIPAHKELLDSTGSGVLFRQGDAADLTAKLEHLLRDADLRAQIGRQAQAAVVERGMTKPAMLAKHSNLYQDILTHKP